MLFNLYTFTVSFIIINIIQITVFGLHCATNRSYSGIGLWLVGFINLTAGLFFLLLNGLGMYNPIPVIVSNALFISGFFMIYAGIKRFFGRKENMRLFLIFFLVYMAAVTYFSTVDDSYRQRIILFSLVWAAISILTGRELALFSGAYTRLSAMALSGLMIFQSLFFIGRAVYTVAREPIYSNFTPAVPQVAMLVLLFIMSGVTAITLIIMVNQRLNWEMKEARDEAQKNREKAENAGHEKEILLKEVHHRIKNNMNTIIALLSIQAETVKEPTARSALNDAEGRVRSMMILYDKLYRSETFSEISAREYLSPLSDEIVNGFPKGKTVTLHKDIDDFMMRSQTLFLMGIMINELLTNSMKYAFSETGSATIDITVRKNDGRVLIITADNGKGFPEGFDIKKSSGFGLQLVSMLTEQLKGTLKTGTAAGSEVTIEFNAQ